MKFPIIFFLSILFLSSASRSQTRPEPLLLPGQSQISAGIGISYIDGTSFYTIGVLPDLSFGDLGIGLDLTLRMNSSDGAIRRVDWADGAYRKVIRYVRWGEKHQPIFAMVGQLDGTALGHGFIMYDYTNSPSYDNRTIGGELDLDFSSFGLETMYGDLHEPGVVGGRIFVRPLRLVGLNSLPFLGGTELGATYVTDRNKNSNVVLVQGESATPPSPLIPKSMGKLSEYGFDIGLPVIRIRNFSSDLYSDYAQIGGHGHGSGVGITGAFNGMVSASAKLERQFSGTHFIPEYFDHFYELERYTPGDTSGYISKAATLDSTDASEGWFGELQISFMTNFRVVGSFRSVDNNPAGSLIHIEARFPYIIPELAFSAGFDRFGTLSFSNILSLNDKSLFYAFFGYKPYPFMTLGLNYFWTYNLVNGDYTVQRRMEPSVMVNFSF